ENRLLDFGENSQHLKDEVADITVNMRENNHRIRFFDDTNPSWRRGTELPCVGEVCTRTLMGFFHKQLSGRRTTAVQQGDRYGFFYPISASDVLSSDTPQPTDF